MEVSNEGISNTKKSNQVDMLNGNLLGKIMFFALSIALSSVLQQLFTSIDVAVLGHFASSNEQAAVGCNGPVINVLLTLFIGISIGSNVVIANYIGRNSSEKISDAVHTSMLFSLYGGILLTVVGIAIARPVLTIMNTPKEVLEYAILYLKIYFLGMPFTLIYNFGSAILRSAGDTKRPLYCLLVSGIVNTLLNIFLVVVMNMGVSGVAIATVTSNIINAIIIIIILLRESGPFQLKISRLHIHGKYLKQMLKIGLPAGIQGMVFSVANLFIQIELNGYGSYVVAGSAVALNFEIFSYFIMSGFNQAAITFTSQNMGAKQFERCKKIFRLCLLSAMILTALSSYSFLVFKEFFTGLFTSDVTVQKFAMIRMIHLLSFNFIAATYEIGAGALRGMNHSMTPAMLTVFGTCVLRLVWIYTVCRAYPGYEVLLNVYPVSWVVTGLAVLIAYYRVRIKAFKSA